jgi:tol-pal system-associated acyl-CoA thioesterase
VSEPAIHVVDVYYEDTDFSGVVYHPNYLRYFERAREHLLGRDELVRLWREDGVGFVVYKAQMTYREGAVFGDQIEVRTTGALGSTWRAVFTQNAHRASDGALLVEGHVELACVDRDGKLVELPVGVRDAMVERFGG